MSIENLGEIVVFPLLIHVIYTHYLKCEYIYIYIYKMWEFMNVDVYNL